MVKPAMNLLLSHLWSPSITILAILCFDLVQCQFFELHTELGRLRGVRFRTSYNAPAVAFLGIPYALPPLGRLRFRRPLPYPKWSPKTLMATEYKSCCPQLDLNGAPHGSEDCLHLNVFVPDTSNQERFTFSQKRLPVMVYIQGESFENGDAALYGAENLIDFDVIVVTFNYRLGVLGFLSTGDEHAPGNWGLYDQHLAIRWVHDHIEAFGGDSSSITLFGQGAGASSAVLHILSPLSTGLFQRVIAQSGSPLCGWSMESNPEEAAQAVARDSGCRPEAMHVDMLKCLRLAPLGKLLAAQQRGKIFGEFPHRMLPVVEHNGPADLRMIPNEPRELIAAGNFRRVSLIMGYNRDETAFFHPLILNKRFVGDTPNLKRYLEDKLLPLFLKATILESANSLHASINSNLVALKTSKAQLEKDVKQNILFKYFNFMNAKNFTDLAGRFVNMSTDALYASCIDETLKLYSAAVEGKLSGLALSGSSSSNFELSPFLPLANITYKYVFGYRGRNSMFGLILSSQHSTRHNRFNSQSTYGDLNRVLTTAVCHGDELFYLFNLKFNTRRPEDVGDQRMMRRLLVLWTDFAKHGYAPSLPSLEVPYWPSYSNHRPYAYYIDDQVSILPSYREAESHFWTRYLPSVVSSSGGSSSASIVAHPAPSLEGREDFHYYDHLSVAKLRTFAWSMLTLSIVLVLFICLLLGLLYYQRRKQSFSAESAHRARERSARALARALARSSRTTSSSSMAEATVPKMCISSRTPIPSSIGKKPNVSSGATSTAALY